MEKVDLKQAILISFGLIILEIVMAFIGGNAYLLDTYSLEGGINMFGLIALLIFSALLIGILIAIRKALYNFAGNHNGSPLDSIKSMSKKQKKVVIVLLALVIGGIIFSSILNQGIIINDDTYSNDYANTDSYTYSDKLVITNLGDFTIDIPENKDLINYYNITNKPFDFNTDEDVEKYNSAKGYVVVDDDNYYEIIGNPEYKDIFHDFWSPSDYSFEIEYFNLEEDISQNTKLTADNLINELVPDAEIVEDDGDIKIYKDNLENYYITKNNNNKTMVLVNGYDLDLLKTIANSIKFR